MLITNAAHIRANVLFRGLETLVKNFTRGYNDIHNIRKAIATTTSLFQGVINHTRRDQLPLIFIEEAENDFLNVFFR
ncbi:MAG: hypothetical protein COA52_06280 [Hyphomicrobiales bacterium]|nr:MAG: hypothetical protein COA52_06280 [Hyphomicrobiales bacterium]